MFNVTIIRRSIRAITCVSAATVLLAACGGGGSGSGDASLAAQSTDQSLPSEFLNNANPNPSGGSGADANAPAPEAGGQTGSGSATTGGTQTGGTSQAEPAQPPQAEPSAPVAEAKNPYGQNASQYTLTFSEEFENGFDTKVWNDAIWYQSSNPTKNYTVENGSLKIWPQRDANGNFFNRTIDTDGKYYQTYGYFEIEAKLPIGKGTWPAFWLFNHIGDRRPEIDVMEAYAGGGPNSGWSDANFHPTAYAPTVWLDQTRLAGTKTIQTGDLSAGFHKYAVKWEPNRQTFYFDGKEVYSLAVTMGDPMYLMLDLWYGSASGQPDNSTPQGKGNAFEINYVRAWTFASQ